MNRSPRLYLVCYDISDDKRLRRIYKLMRGYGDPVQYSIFRCALTPIRVAELVGRVEEIIHHDDDQVLLVPLGLADRPESWEVTTLGRPVPRPESTVKVF